MKRHLSIFLLIVTFLVPNISCTNANVKPSKNYITRNYKIETEFDKLNISAVGDVYYTQSTDGTYAVSIYGPDNIIELFEVNVNNKTLSVGMVKKGRNNNVNKMKIIISSPDLNDLNFTGVGNVYIEEGLQTGDFKIQNHGVGNVKINNLSCADVDIKLTGVGNINITGKAEKAVISSNGVGEIKASDLHAKNVTVSTKGVGNISCYASESINASTTGVGNISYSGNPGTKDISKSGVGSIKAK